MVVVVVVVVVGVVVVVVVVGVVVVVVVVGVVVVVVVVVVVGVVSGTHRSGVCSQWNPGSHPTQTAVGSGNDVSNGGRVSQTPSPSKPRSTDELPV